MVIIRNGLNTLDTFKSLPSSAVPSDVSLYYYTLYAVFKLLLLLMLHLHCTHRLVLCAMCEAGVVRSGSECAREHGNNLFPESPSSLPVL